MYDAVQMGFFVLLIKESSPIANMQTTLGGVQKNNIHMHSHGYELISTILTVLQFPDVFFNTKLPQ